MEYLPIFLELNQKPALVVGNQEALVSKINLLLKAGAVVTLVGSKLHPALQSLVIEKGFLQLEESFQSEMLDGKKIVFIADQDEALEARVYQEASKRCIPVNVIDKTAQCDFIMPSLVDRSPLIIAVSSSGSCPRLARMVRAKLETLFPQSYSRLAMVMGELRLKSRNLIPDIKQRGLFWNKIFNSPIVEMFLSGKEKMAQKALEKELSEAGGKEHKYGQVCLVGAGPGDPDLLTLRALRLIQNADVVVYDRLVAPQILDYARREAQRIYVGKENSLHVVPQDQINQILVDFAKDGKMVVRLKGGDPFMFGRGGEEVIELLESKINFQIVPGVTAASGCGTYAGIPLTHRDYAQSCRMITGHLKEGDLNLDWEGLVQKNQTLVFYMGLATLPLISKNLIAHGMNPKMPAALIEKGTTTEQRVLVGTIADLPLLNKTAKMKAPSLIIIGEVVSLREKLKWFEPAEFDQ